MIEVALTKILPCTGRCPAGAEGSRLSAGVVQAARRDPSVTPMARHLPVPGRICVAPAHPKHYNDLVM